MTSEGFGGITRDVGWLLVPAACLLGLMVGLGFLLTDVLPSTALGKWDADVPRRLVEYRQQEGISESKLITTLSETPTIIILTALAAAVCRWTFGRWRDAQLEAVRAGSPEPVSADPLTMEGRSDAATAPGALSPNLAPGRRQGLVRR